jgi:hypothetical protein
MGIFESNRETNGSHERHENHKIRRYGSFAQGGNISGPPGFMPSGRRAFADSVLLVFFVAAF